MFNVAKAIFFENGKRWNADEHRKVIGKNSIREDRRKLRENFCIPLIARNL